MDSGATCLSFSTTAGTGTWGGVLTHNAINWTIAGSLTLNSGMTYTPADGSLITITANATLTTGGLLMTSISQTGGAFTLGDNLSFAATKTKSLTLGGTSFTMNGKSINGNSAVNRILITSATLGTAKTITSATTSFTNADFRDITFSSASSLDLSAISGKSGDCGGNTITGGGTTLTFTTPATQTWSGTSGANWSANAWTSRVPLPQDNALIASAFSALQTIVADMPRLGKSVDFTGTTGLNIFQIGSGTTNTVYGSLTLVNSSGISTFTKSGSAFVFEGRGSFTLTSAGQSFGSGGVTIQMIGGTLVLQDAFVISGTASLFTLSNGTFNDNSMSVSLSGNFSSSNTNTRALVMGTANTWTMSSTGGTVWNTATATGLTLTPGTATIKMTDGGNTGLTFQGGGLTFGTLYWSRGASTGTNTIVGANTFGGFTDDGSGAHTIVFPNATTTVSSFSVNGSVGNIITLSNTSGSAFFTISCPSGNQNCNYISISNGIASGGAFFYAGANSTDGGNNFGWIFTSGSSYYVSQSPTTTVDDPTIGSLTWTNPNNVQVSDGVFATATTNATLTDNSIKLVKGNSIVGADQSVGGTWSINPTETYDSFGGPTNTWNQTWAAADVNDPTFGNVLSVKFGATISHYLKATGFGFNIPPTAAIVGVVTQYQRTSITCFVKGTKISVTRGRKNIEEVKAGEFVFSGDGNLVKVLSVSKRISKGYFSLSTGRRSIGATAEHPFLTDSGWVIAKNLKIGDLLITEDGVEILKKKTFFSGKIDVYNLAVGQPHTYMANGFRVHNYITWTAQVDFELMQVYFTLPSASAASASPRRKKKTLMGVGL